jgi:hypothetical protein
MDALQIKIQNVILEITEGEFQHVSQNLLHYCEMCLDAGGHHIQ